MLSYYSSHSPLLPPEPITFAPQHRGIQCKHGPFPRSLSPFPSSLPLPLPFLIASSRPRPLPLPLPLPPPKATTITSVAASLASTTCNQEVLFTPTIIATHNHDVPREA